MTTPTKTIDELAKEHPSCIRVLGENDPHYQIWKSAWQGAHELFDTEDGFPVLRIRVPFHGLSRIIVRPEYVQAYEDAQLAYTDALMKRKVRSFDTPDDHTTFTLKEACAGLYDHDPCPAQRPCRHALIMTGQSSNGKTTFLWYVLIRRLAIQEVVVYQTHPEVLYIFHKHGVTRVTLNSILSPIDVQEVLPFSAWCLIDSNQDMVNPISFVLNLERFLVQAASPDALAKYWFERVGVPSSLYILKPMSLREVELSRGCMESFPEDLEDVRKFHALYGPSSRGALTPSAIAWKFKVESALRLLGHSMSLLVEIIQDLTQAVDRYPDITSRILLLKPGPQRHLGHVEVVTEHIFGLLVDWACKGSLAQSRALYSGLAGGPPAAETLARHLLVEYVDSMLVAGGVYTFVPLRGEDRTSKVLDKPGGKNFLILPAKNSTCEIQPRPGPFVHDDTKTISRKDFDFDSQSLAELEDYTYYKCISKQRATLDSFMCINEVTTLVAFKVITSTEHEIVRSDLEWLNAVPIDPDIGERVGLAFMGISPNKDLKLVCKDGAEELIYGFYHLKLDGFPTSIK